MEFSEVVRRRRMVRRYTSDPVDEDRLQRVIDTARKGPSAGYSQGQYFVVVTDRAVRVKMAEVAREPYYVNRGFQPWLSSAPVLVLCCVSEKAYRARYDEPDKRLKGAAARSWPVPYWYVDGGCALMLLLLAAADEGLAAGFLDLGEEGYEQASALLGIPDEVKPIGLVTLGYPADDPPTGSAQRSPRPAEQVVHRDRWEY